MGVSSFLACFGIHTYLEVVALGVPLLGCHAAFSSFVVCGCLSQGFSFYFPLDLPFSFSLAFS
jgi:hypothetical protein